MFYLEQMTSLCIKQQWISLTYPAVYRYSDFEWFWLRLILSWMGQATRTTRPPRSLLGAGDGHLDQLFGPGKVQCALGTLLAGRGQAGRTSCSLYQVETEDSCCRQSWEDMRSCKYNLAPVFTGGSFFLWGIFISRASHAQVKDFHREEEGKNNNRCALGKSSGFIYTSFHVLKLWKLRNGRRRNVATGWWRCLGSRRMMPICWDFNGSAGHVRKRKVICTKLQCMKIVAHISLAF